MGARCAKTQYVKLGALQYCLWPARKFITFDIAEPLNFFCAAPSAVFSGAAVHWGSGWRTDSGARSEQTQGPALGAPAPEGVPSDLGYLEH
eukprot:COSAG04_NODE_7810_length_1063_cov_3.089212_2_plen_90_part_01